MECGHSAIYLSTQLSPQLPVVKDWDPSLDREEAEWGLTATPSVILRHSRRFLETRAEALRAQEATW